MRATAFVTAAVAVCVCVLLPAAAQGIPTDVRATATEEIATDYPSADEQRDAAIMDPLVEALSIAVGESDREVPTIDGAANRYAGFKVDYPAHRIDLYWAGEVPDSIRALIRAHPDVDVATHVAEYSQIEMLEARDRIAAERSSLEQTLGTLLTVGPDYQGRGLKVQTSAGTELGRRAANSVVDDISGVPIFSLEANVGEITTFAGSRQNDTSPHYGGAGVLITNVAQTEGGFGSRIDSTCAAVILAVMVFLLSFVTGEPPRSRWLNDRRALCGPRRGQHPPSNRCQPSRRRRRRRTDQRWDTRRRWMRTRPAARRSEKLL